MVQLQRWKIPLLTGTVVSFTELSFCTNVRIKSTSHCPWFIAFHVNFGQPSAVWINTTLLMKTVGKKKQKTNKKQKNKCTYAKRDTLESCKVFMNNYIFVLFVL